MMNEENEFIKGIKKDLDSIISLKKSEIVDKVKDLTLLKFDIINSEINFLFDEKKKENVIYHDTSIMTFTNNSELIKHQIFKLDNELRTLYFIKGTFRDSDELPKKEINKSVI